MTNATQSPARGVEVTQEETLDFLGEAFRNQRIGLTSADVEDIRVALTTIVRRHQSSGELERLRELLGKAVTACQHPVMFPQLELNILAALAIKGGEDAA